MSLLLVFISIVLSSTIHEFCFSELGRRTWWTQHTHFLFLRARAALVSRYVTFLNFIFFLKCSCTQVFVLYQKVIFFGLFVCLFFELEMSRRIGPRDYYSWVFVSKNWCLIIRTVFIRRTILNRGWLCFNITDFEFPAIIPAFALLAALPSSSRTAWVAEVWRRIRLEWSL